MNESSLRQMLLPTITANLILTFSLITSTCLMAVEPNAIDQQRIQQGRALFERVWPSRNPGLGSDGLGPLHNAKSCVACHHQGGVGGSGGARFNAKSIGIEKLRLTGPKPSIVAPSMLAEIHPGFVAPNGSLTNAIPLQHFGSTAFLNANKAIISGNRASFSPSGGPLNAEEVRVANATPFVYASRKGPHQLTVHGRIYQRNTPPLFGSGLIDQVSRKTMDAVAKAQKAHPEISGRPSTLVDGRYGKFGWRGNIASLIDFNDQACAAELGLETRRKKQPIDPLYPNYKNTSIDITDTQIRTLTSFVKALPAPIRDISLDSVDHEQVARGEQQFSAIGCSICHQPNLENAIGIYSDLLLHDMGYELKDINFAEPHRIRSERIANSVPPPSLSFSTYYGNATGISPNNNRSTDSLSNPGLSPNSDISFNAPTQPKKIQYVTLGRSSETLTEEAGETNSAGAGRSTREVRDMEHQLRIQIEPTNHMQEWRTPPLWGVRDSAPYMHDGRAGTLLEAVSMHEGEAAGTRDRFLNLSHRDRSAIIKFMETLIAPVNVPKAKL